MSFAVTSGLFRGDVPALFLVIPVALLGRRWGTAGALLAAAAAMVLAVTVITGGPIGIIGYLSRATALGTVALLSGMSRRRSEQSGPSVPSHGSASPAGRARPEELLSVRELQVLTLIAAGATNAEIAAQLVIAESTVQSHVQHILRKLEVRNRTEAAARFLEDNGHALDPGWRSGAARPLTSRVPWRHKGRV
jgi:DNA-binding CsgD family transcriptional regulator